MKLNLLELEIILASLADYQHKLVSRHNNEPFDAQQRYEDTERLENKLCKYREKLNG